MPDGLRTEGPLGPAAADREPMAVESNGGQWVISWHPPGEEPPGEPHGASAFCLTDDGSVVLISSDGNRWGWPGGRPEGGETWEEVLRREIREETCCEVQTARLLGFVQARCVSGPEAGLVLVRSIWRADVSVLEWAPEHEISHRRLVPASGLADHLEMEPGFEPVYARAAREAGLFR